jgi:upstream activation factor subunit UAF30
MLSHGGNASLSVNQAPKESAPAGTKRKGGPGGLNKVCRVSPELEVVVGEPALPRTEIVRQLWAYIRKNNLQDPSNKRKIICDDALRVVFETDCTDMFKMNKLLAKHILPLDPSKDSGQAKKAKTEVETKTETTEPISSTAISSTVTLSEPLGKFFGTGETEMADEEIIRRVWEYIKLNNLEDPVNPMAIQCDEKLRDLLGCESISAVGINEMLRRHMYKQS